MEQIKIINANLNINEKKNIFLAIACGCLGTINDSIPGPAHQRKKRVLATLRQTILQTIAPRLPSVQRHNMALFRDTIMASERVLDKIVDESQQNSVHILLNLVGHCLDELPTPKNISKKYNELFNLWEEAHRYEDARSGDRILHRINAEVDILVAQRGGAIV